jgi:AAA domain
MSEPILILGESGHGKSTSMRNMDPATTLLIQSIDKRLPFPNAKEWQKFDPQTKKGNVFVTDQASEITALMAKTKRDKIIIDDFQYVMANEFMRRSFEKGYDKFTEIGRNAWDVLRMASQLDPATRVYLLAHTDTSDSGRVVMKTIGKMLSEKITVEGMFTIVLRCVVRERDYLFSTHSNGNDTAKSPMGMFEEDLIENDLAAVDARICEYYGIGPKREAK